MQQRLESMPQPRILNWVSRVGDKMVDVNRSTISPSIGNLESLPDHTMGNCPCIAVVSTECNSPGGTLSGTGIGVTMRRCRVSTRTLTGFRSNNWAAGLPGLGTSQQIVGRNRWCCSLNSKTQIPQGCPPRHKGNHSATIRDRGCPPSRTEVRSTSTYPLGYTRRIRP